MRNYPIMPQIPPPVDLFTGTGPNNEPPYELSQYRRDDPTVFQTAQDHWRARRQECEKEAAPAPATFSIREISEERECGPYGILVCPVQVFLRLADTCAIAEEDAPTHAATGTICQRLAEVDGSKHVADVDRLALIGGSVRAQPVDAEAAAVGASAFRARVEDDTNTDIVAGRMLAGMIFKNMQGEAEYSPTI
eukprot:761145-Hanusia_phi.AAC.2